MKNARQPAGAANHRALRAGDSAAIEILKFLSGFLLATVTGLGIAFALFVLLFVSQ